MTGQLRQTSEAWTTCPKLAQLEEKDTIWKKVGDACPHILEIPRGADVVTVVLASSLHSPCPSQTARPLRAILTGVQSLPLPVTCVSL